jgi:hypothetical protein
MRSFSVCCIAFSLANLAHAAAPVEEFWEVAQIEGARIGFTHTATEAADADDGKHYRTTTELDLTLRRYNALVKLRMEQQTEETAAGKVIAVGMRQFHDKGRQVDLTGKLDGDRMHIVIDNGRIDKRLPWSDTVVGLYGRERLWQQRKPKAGDRFTIAYFEPMVSTIVKLRAVVGEAEEVSMLTGKKKLLRVDLTPDKLEAPGIRLQLPVSVVWLDESFVPVRRQIDMDGLGTVLLLRAPRETALRPVSLPAGRAADLGLKGLVPLNRTIDRPHTTRSAVYRITLRGDKDAVTALVSDAHQEVREAHGDQFELHVHPVRPGQGKAEKGAAAEEFLGPSHFVNCDDPRVRELARKAVGSEKDPWQKAMRIEKWVKQAMHPDNAAPFAPAGQVARDLRGDCRLYALLTTAMCRAEGVPARVAVGLIYVEKAGRKPNMGFHMWTEVRIDSRWIGLDATLGQGGVGAGHIKIADHSWHATQSLTPLLPVSRVLGKIAIEVVDVE